MVEKILSEFKKKGVPEEKIKILAKAYNSLQSVEADLDLMRMALAAFSLLRMMRSDFQKTFDGCESTQLVSCIEEIVDALKKSHYNEKIIFSKNEEKQK